MSVCLMISNPINKNEEAYYVPISTERVFREYWMPIIIDLDLQWIKCFQSGIEIEKEDFNFVLEELMKICEYINERCHNEESKRIVERIDNLSKELKIILKDMRNDIKVYIG